MNTMKESDVPCGTSDAGIVVVVLVYVKVVCGTAFWCIPIAENLFHERYLFCIRMLICSLLLFSKHASDDSTE